MAWLRVDDTALTHPMVMHLRECEEGDDTVSGERVIGFIVLAAAWAGAHLTDCWLPISVARMASPNAHALLAAAACQVGLLTEDERDGRKGYLVNIDDGSPFHLMSKAEVERNRAKRRMTRKDEPVIEVLLRDGDQCRYCEDTVNPKDTTGKQGRGRQFDHPDPADRDTFVVACRRCNSAKGERTPDEAGMHLTDPPAPHQRHFHPHTLAWLSARNVDPGPHGALTAASEPQAPTGSPPAQEAPSAPQSAAGPVDQQLQTNQTNEQPPGPVAYPHRPGRDGTGRAGPGQDRTGVAVAVAPGPSPPARPSGKRKRGSRGRRGRPPPPDQRTSA